MYTEWPSRVSGAVMWTSTRAGGTTRVLPDGCMDMIWDNGSLVVAGPDTSAHLTANGPRTAPVVAIRFAPGTAPSLLDVSARDMLDRRVPLDAVWGNAAARRLAEQLADSSDPASVLEDCAIRRAADGGAPPRIIGEVTRRTRMSDDVDSVAAAVGLSSRQLRRRCVDSYGYGPKTLSRILRMNHALDLIRARTPQAHAAAAAGYADQAHMCREIKALAGTTVGELIR